ncbi:MAG: valine--tRNA ligase [Candidatus Nanopelagicales bacterium]
MTQLPPQHNVPDKPSLANLEDKWGKKWVTEKTFAFDKSAPREAVYAIDTPPPTVSGALHVGHVFSYTHTDLIARYQRMSGKSVFYPIGWDDNGLPTERRVQNYFGVRCDSLLAYQANYQPEKSDSETQVAISRKNFVELCEYLTTEDEKAFEELFQTLGLSIDWDYTYQTIDEKARVVSQRAFLRNLERQEAYQAEAPTLWDVTFKTAVAQAELEDRERPGAYHRIRFKKPDNSFVEIETTRPELLPACVALVAHPDDERYKPLFGTTVKTPLFEVEVPVVAHSLADPEKGSGIAMICTFGDLTDVTWWREFNLPTRPIIGWDGRLTKECPSWIESALGISLWPEIAGKTAHSAKESIANLLKDSGDLIGEIRPITHPVKFFEKGDKPLEIVTTRQWYIKNGGRDQALRKDLLGRGTELNWHPDYMKVRYQNWVEGLNGDWLISRQRFFGVPLPLWYRLDANGNPDYSQVITPNEADLPIDPQSDVPSGFTEEQRNQPNGFMGDPDVMDTWATSSLSPQIAARWELDKELFEKVFPMNLRPQSHEIIRTWLFSSVVRANSEHNSLPWTDVAISGWILDPDRKKMSKSKGNVITPMNLLQEYGSDAVRYWAAMGRPGTDTAFDTGQMKIGRRLAIKILNASKFGLTLGANSNFENITNPLDKSMLAQLTQVVENSTKAFLTYDYTKALESVETFFWNFTDDYLELIKERIYGAQGEAEAESAKAALGLALSILQRLFAPFLPFVTEEVWSWWQTGSIHKKPWPKSEELHAYAENPELLADVSAVLTEVRKAKTVAQLSMRADVSQLVVSCNDVFANHLKSAQKDLFAAGRVQNLEITQGDELSIKVSLA